VRQGRWGRQKGSQKEGETEKVRSAKKGHKEKVRQRRWGQQKRRQREGDSERG
jgi:hypothetical protein